MIMTELCAELRNWFDRGQPKFNGTFEISNGQLTDESFIEAIQNNQYFRIVGSVFNDGIYKYPYQGFKDEIFTGSICLMAVPNEIIALADEIDEWLEKYSGVSVSPYQSESFGGYAYSKADFGSSDGSNSLSWQTVFAKKLNLWRKV